MLNKAFFNKINIKNEINDSSNSNIKNNSLVNCGLITGFKKFFIAKTKQNLSNNTKETYNDKATLTGKD